MPVKSNHGLLKKVQSPDVSDIHTNTGMLFTSERKRCSLSRSAESVLCCRRLSTDKSRKGMEGRKRNNWIDKTTDSGELDANGPRPARAPYVATTLMTDKTAEVPRGPNRTAVQS